MINRTFFSIWILTLSACVTEAVNPQSGKVLNLKGESSLSFPSELDVVAPCIHRLQFERFDGPRTVLACVSSESKSEEALVDMLYTLIASQGFEISFASKNGIHASEQLSEKACPSRIEVQTMISGDGVWTPVDSTIIWQDREILLLLEAPKLNTPECRIQFYGND